MEEISVTRAQEEFARLLRRVESEGDRIVLTRSGKPMGALIPVELLKEIEAVEDAADLAAARAAASEPGASVPHAQVLADLVADEASAGDRPPRSA